MQLRGAEQHNRLKVRTRFFHQPTQHHTCRAWSGEVPIGDAKQMQVSESAALGLKSAPLICTYREVGKIVFGRLRAEARSLDSGGAMGGKKWPQVLCCVCCSVSNGKHQQKPAMLWFLQLFLLLAAWSPLATADTTYTGINGYTTIYTSTTFYVTTWTYTTDDYYTATITQDFTKITVKTTETQTVQASGATGKTVTVTNSVTETPRARRLRVREPLPIPPAPTSSSPPSAPAPAPTKAPPPLRIAPRQLTLDLSDWYTSTGYYYVYVYTWTTTVSTYYDYHGTTTTTSPGSDYFTFAATITTTTTTTVSNSDPITTTITVTVAPAATPEVPVGAIVGGTVGGVAGIALLLVGAFILWRRRKGGAGDHDGTPPGVVEDHEGYRRSQMMSPTHTFSSAPTAEGGVYPYAGMGTETMKEVVSPVVSPVASPAMMKPGYASYPGSPHPQ